MSSPFEGLKYFKRSEFDSPDVAGSGDGMSRELLEKLEALRKRVGRPLRINSGFRTAAHNASIKGKANSAHLRGLAADISTLDSKVRFAVLEAARSLGIRRLEIAPRHVHIDVDPSLPQDVCDFIGSYPK